MSGAITILAFHQAYQPLGGSILVSAISTKHKITDYNAT